MPLYLVVHSQLPPASGVSSKVKEAMTEDAKWLYSWVQMNDEGSILAMSYLGAVQYVQKYDLMGMAKAALESIVRYLSVDMGGRGIKVNAISAGPIKTLAARGVSDFSRLLTHVTEKSPLQRNVTQDDVAGTATYLCSSMSSGVTGQVLYVDSGYNIVGV